MNEKFLDYFKENFFPNKDEFEKFKSSLFKPLKRSLRVNTNKINIPDLVSKLESQNYKLTPTFQDNVFYVERKEWFDEFERRLWFTLEHLQGYFYIQELWASSSVFFLSWWEKDTKPYLILDMAASPWWKTTQLSEYYPNSFIVANEFDKNRTSQLIANIERMWCENIWICNYNGQFLWRFSEEFDKVLLDAPCSWEWIWFKSQESLKYWNLKNVKKIADIQKKLFEAWLSALKVWWEMLYSTCTMNSLENEQVIETILSKYPWSFDVTFQKRFWPHIDETWWFFVCKITKRKSIDYISNDKPLISNNWIERLSNKDEKILDKYIDIGHSYPYLNFRKFGHEILALKWESYEKIKDKIYFFRLWKKIWKLEKDRFEWNHYFWRDYKNNISNKYDIKNEVELDRYFRWYNIAENLNQWEYQITYNNQNISFSSTDKDGKLKNNFPTIWMRK